MLVGQAQRWRRLLERESRLTSDGRFVDYGLRLYIVEQDPAGQVVLPGREPIFAVEKHDFGGVWDIRANKWEGESPDPVILYCSREQFPLIVHGDDLPPRLLVYGAMGAGKTRGVLTPWLLMRCIQFAGYHGEIGVTAPTYKRVDLVREAIVASTPPSWYRWRARDLLFRFHLGIRLRLVSTKQQSAAAGSPVQGHDWMAHAGDEIQDQLETDSDIEMRGRRAPGGRYMRLNTATAKDTTDWRNWRDGLDPSLWKIARLQGTSNPFVAKRYWEDAKKTMSERDYQRKVLAMDVGPEQMTYITFSREHNVRPIPSIGARDVTNEILAPYGGGEYLIGHDPGQIQDVSILLKAYRELGSREHSWWVVDELTTLRTTTDQHAAALVQHLKSRSLTGDEFPRVHLRIDPYGDSDNKTDKTVYQTFGHYGFAALSAAYKNGQGTGKIKKDAGIEMINRLFCNAAGERRLFIACDDRRNPLAPKLLHAIEMSERDSDGKAETQRKDKHDLSHWPSALRFALWPFERRIEAAA